MLFRAIAALSLALLYLPAAPPADGSPTTKQELMAEYMKADAAMKAKNIKGLMMRYTPDFKLKVDSSTVLTRAEVEDRMAMQFVATVEIKSMKFNIESITLRGKEALVTVKQTQTLIVTTGYVKHTRVNAQTSLDTWIKTDKGWRLKYQVVKKSLTTEDGKPMKQISMLQTGAWRLSRAA